MRGKEGDKNAEEEKKVYRYKTCSGCGIKLHCDTYRCWKCGEKPILGFYHSDNSEDAKHSLPLNSVEKCVHCCNVQFGLQVCKPIICFGTGRGKCDLCKQLAGTRFDCCQQYQKDEGVPNIEGIKNIFRGIGSIGKNSFIKPRQEVPF